MKNEWNDEMEIDADPFGSDGDNAITAADAVFAHLRVWRDMPDNGSIGLRGAASLDVRGYRMPRMERAGMPRHLVRRGVNREPGCFKQSTGFGI